MYLISAYFDEATNKQLQGYIDRIAQATVMAATYHFGKDSYYGADASGGSADGRF